MEDTLCCWAARKSQMFWLRNLQHVRYIAQHEIHGSTALLYFQKDGALIGILSSLHNFPLLDHSKLNRKNAIVKSRIRLAMCESDARQRMYHEKTVSEPTLFTLNITIVHILGSLGESSEDWALGLISQHFLHQAKNRLAAWLEMMFQKFNLRTVNSCKKLLLT